MREEKVKGRRLDQFAVKAMASIAREVARDSLDSRCWMFLYQPEEPKDLAERLKAMGK